MDNDADPYARSRVAGTAEAVSAAGDHKEGEAAIEVDEGPASSWSFLTVPLRGWLPAKILQDGISVRVGSKSH